MATQPDTGSRLWRGLRSLMFGEDSEPTLRDTIEEAIDDAEDDQPRKGDLSPLERQMLKNLLHFGDRTAGDICVTRGEIISAPHDASMGELARMFAEAGHSRLPITGESLDEIIGMVHIKDVFNAYFDATERKSVDEIIRTPLFVPESMGVLDLLARMRAERVHLAVVIDEFGGTEGLVTIEDVVEEIVGDIADEHDEEELPRLARLEDGLWEADARLELEEVARSVDARLIAEEDEVDTLGGLAFLLAGRILSPGESIAHPSGWRLESLEADERKMHRLRLHAPEGVEVEG
ncbi:hemolysin family protein [Sphingomonas sp. LHG3406-1]|uniref:hemolysin family protein n=1 Tax=Sphingomonas sp. LHG3406-1 TaxID=2804617 RepID=UPI002613F62E|nr:hemolysin family protein [Sphingomonas sp. LHG3406-1]